MKFDIQQFYFVLNARREQLNMTWREVAKAAHVSTSMVSRLSINKIPTINYCAALARWAQVSLDDFLVEDEIEKQGNYVKTIEAVYAALSNDPSLSKEDVSVIWNIVHIMYAYLSEKACFK